jgi:uncharacterized membrane protein HdeD (DUF308 family)
MAEGVSLLLLGALSLLTATAANATVLGIILLCAGLITLLSVWRAERYPAFGLSVLLALVASGTGLHLLGDPPKTSLGLTFAGYFALRGTATILLATALRRQHFKEWEWFAVSGATSLILAGLILAGLPGPYVWMLGLLLGVALAFDGSALLALVLASNTANDPALAPTLNEAPVTAQPSSPVCEDGLPV